MLKLPAPRAERIQENGSVASELQVKIVRSKGRSECIMSSLPGPLVILRHLINNLLSDKSQRTPTVSKSSD
jgi:hypothetical protein